MKIRINLEANQQLLAWVLIAPTLIAVFAVLLYPLGYSLLISFSSVTLGKSEYNFVGFSNYIKAFTDPQFWFSLRTTCIFLVTVLTGEMVLALFCALLLNEHHFGRGISRSLIVIPWATPQIVVGLIWRWIFNSKVGLLNYILFRLGVTSDYIAWLSDKTFALWAVCLAAVWQLTPFFVIIILAGLQTIPAELYKVAEIDGAGMAVKFFRITIPMIRFPLMVSLLLGTILSINQFDIFWIMTRGGPANYTEVITIYDWKVAFKYFRTNYAAAISYIILAVNLALAFVYARMIQRGEE